MNHPTKLIKYFEHRANGIVYKYSTSTSITNYNHPSSILQFHNALQGIEQELDAEINSIVADHQHVKRSDLETLITGLYFSKEKAKYEFSKLFSF